MHAMEGAAMEVAAMEADLDTSMDVDSSWEMEGG